MAGLEDDYILVYRGKSVEEFDELNDPTSRASEVARARGETTPLDLEASEKGPDQELYSVEEGKLKTETGYFMRFIPEYATDLTRFDNVNLLSRRDYPVRPSAVESLSPRARYRLEEQDYVKLTGFYDSDKHRYEKLTVGWNEASADPWELLWKLVQLCPDSPTAVLSYALVEHGPADVTPEVIADARGLASDYHVRNHVERVKKELASNDA
jgi:hypothetical protein